MTLKQVWFITASDLLVNLSAGWFGVAFILPASTVRLKQINFWFLTIDILFGILSLVTAFLLRKDVYL